MSSESHGEPDTPPESDPAAQRPEVRLVGTRLGLFPYGYAWRAPLRRLRVILVAYLPVYLVGLLALVPLQFVGDTAVVNGAVELFELSPAWLVVGGVLLVVCLPVLLVAHGAATLVAVAESVRIQPTAGADSAETDDAEPAEEPRAPVMTLRAPLVAAAKRLPTLFVLWLLGALLLVAVFAVVLASTFTDLPIGLAIAFVALLAWLAFSPFAVAWPVALAERRGPFDALRRSIDLTRGRMFRLGLFVLFFGYLLPGGVSYGVGRIPDLFGSWVPPWPAALLLAVLGWAVPILGLAVLASVQVATLFSDKMVADLHPATDEQQQLLPRSRHRHVIDRDRLLGALDLPSRDWRWVARRRGDVALRVVAGLVVPGMLAVGLLWVNPAGAPSYAKAELSDSTSDLRHRLVPMPDGSVTVATRVSGSVYFDRCVGAQCIELPADEENDEDDQDDEDPLYLAGSGIAGAPLGDRLVLSGWRRDDGNTRDEEDALPKLRLLTCRPAKCTTEAGESAPVLDRYEPQYEGDGLDELDVRTNVAADGAGGYVVVSFVEGGELAVYHCADRRCAEPKKTVLDEPDLSLIPHRSELLDLAVHDDQVAVVLTDTDTGEVTLYTCADAECSDPQRTVVVEAQRERSELETQYRLGAQVVFTGTRPVVAYRGLLDGTVRLLSCADLACDDRETRALTGQGWGHPWPTLAVDHDGRPLVATYDLTARNLVLVACRDTSCERRTSVRLDRWDDGPGNTALTVDGANRPVVLRIDQHPAADLADRGRSDVLTCDEARCGAP